MSCSSRQRHRLRWRCFAKRVPPGEKRLCIANEGFDKKGDEKLALNPSQPRLRVGLAKMAQCQYGLQPFEDQFNLPTPPIHFQDVRSTQVLLASRGKNKEVSGRLQGFRSRLATGLLRLSTKLLLRPFSSLAAFLQRAYAPLDGLVLPLDAYGPVPNPGSPQLPQVAQQVESATLRRL